MLGYLWNSSDLSSSTTYTYIMNMQLGVRDFKETTWENLRLKKYFSRLILKFNTSLSTQIQLMQKIYFKIINQVDAANGNEHAIASFFFSRLYKDCSIFQSLGKFWFVRNGLEKRSSPTITLFDGLFLRNIIRYQTEIHKNTDTVLMIVFIIFRSGI